ncbi:MAG: hypothetical protein Q7S27_06600 [Nanoarchaeota archaeon]|nr:hypothetical protein [Nanoarchaeota archaeon]
MQGQETINFKVYRAEAEKNKDGLTVRLYYPDKKEEINRRLDENLSWGVNVFKNLIKDRYSVIADSQNPIKPAAAGSLYVFNDGNILVHRRDSRAPTHPMYHSACGGYPTREECSRNERGLMETALRETAEECLLVTRDSTPRLIVPKDSKNYTIETAKKLGLGLETIELNVETLDAPDTLEVYQEDGTLIYSSRAFLDLLWESSTSLTALQLRKLPLSVEDVLPIDGEGMMKDGKFIHFNRESYFLSPHEITYKKFGEVLDNPRVFQTRIINGMPEIYNPQYSSPYLGPENLKVIHPHVWAPEDMLVTCLDGLGISGYKGKKLEIEMIKTMNKLNKKNLIPEINLES